MFTGIVEEVGTVVEAGPGRLGVEGPATVADAALGDSIAVSGVCLTVVALDGGVFWADVMSETARRTTVGGLAPGARVNLERALRVDGRLGGHIVQGHVDGVGTLVEREAGAEFDLFRFAVDDALARYIAPQGSIAIDGVSLTVVDTRPPGLTVGLIPATLRHTTLGSLAPGGRVNLEVDVLAKYVERLLGPLAPGRGASA
jgi:riboflavin synthase